jgi:ABC-2 type transport system ATP-binding protein
MISLTNLSKKYGDFTAVDDLDLDIAPGELFGFLGPNGAGKTTTIKMMVGLLRPDKGTAVMAGHDIMSEPVEAKREIGYVSDNPFLYEKLTGREFLEFIGDLWQMEEAKRDANILRYLDLFDLNEKADEFVKTYSHGMRQKIALASALIHEPSILLLDEPTVGLDPKSARLMKDLLRSFCDQRGTVFISTHILEIAERLCDRVGIIDKGKLIALGSLQDLRAKTNKPKESLEDIFMKLTEDKIADFVDK